MRVMSWNVNKSSNREGRIDEQLAVIEERDVDILMLQEVRYGRGMKWAEHWTERLAEIGLGEIEHSLDTAAELAKSTTAPHHEIGHDNGHITAVTEDWSLESKENPPHEALHDGDTETTHFPEKILATNVETPHGRVELWNIRAVPGNSWGVEKVKIFETVYDHLTSSDDTVKILAGDFNSPKTELVDGQAVPFGHDKGGTLGPRQVNAELRILKGLGHLGMHDVFRTQHGYRDVDVPETSWNSKRFDHLFASDLFTPNRCVYDHDTQKCSDHAAIIADLDV